MFIHFLMVLVLLKRKYHSVFICNHLINKAVSYFFWPKGAVKGESLGASGIYSFADFFHLMSPVRYIHMVSQHQFIHFHCKIFLYMTVSQFTILLLMAIGIISIFFFTMNSVAMNITVIIVRRNYWVIRCIHTHTHTL